MPDRNPNGDWGRAAALFGQAASVSEQGGNRASQVRDLFMNAYCKLKGNGSDLTVDIKDVLQRARKIAREIGDAKKIEEIDRLLQLR
jgi:hypothetical protein